MEQIKLFINGKVETNDREFTRVLGGFDENKPCISDIQIAELLDYKNGARQVRQQIERNITHFENGIHLLDLQRVAVSDTLQETLISLGYAKQSITQAKNIYILSEAGFLLYLKFAEGDKAVELYKDFIEDYFKIKAENIAMEKTLEETRIGLIDSKKFLLGSMFLEQDEIKKMELFNQVEKINNQIKDIEVTLAKENLMEQVQGSLAIAERFVNSGKLYDVGEFSKILDIKGFGRNKLFEWMRENKMLMQNNRPYSSHMEYFKIIPIENNKFATSKTLIKSQGISYIVKKLIKDRKIMRKTYEDVIKDINDNLDVAN